MKYYHGTDKKFDHLILGTASKVNINKGGGEIGKGFYTTNDLWIAKAWAIGRYGNENASVIEFSFDESTLLSLSSKLIMTVNDLIGIWIGLKRTKRTRTFTFGVGLVNAPFATIDSARQYKFESKDAEVLLNSITAKKVF